MALYSDYGWKIVPNNGGYSEMGEAYLAGWLGPVSEIDDSYNPYSYLSPQLSGLLHVQNIIYIKRDSIYDNDEVKKAIMDYGAVSSDIHWEFDTYIKDGINYYYWGNSRINHAVTIVGWDDNYPKENFNGNPPGDGAWIVKNSWGVAYGEMGYYYVSYYDTSILPVSEQISGYTFIFNSTMNYDRNYQYDTAGRTNYFKDTSDTLWYKNRFISVGDEYLAAVSTYFEKNTEYELQVYVNGDLKVEKTGNSHAGYYTIELGELIPLMKGDEFEVVFKITVDSNVGVPISQISYLNKMIYGKNVSFLSDDGIHWYDFYTFLERYSQDSYSLSQAACIKAFTVADKLNCTVELKLKKNYIEADVYNQYGYPVKSGNLTLTVNSQKYNVEIADGVGILEFEGEITDISAEFASEGYSSNFTLRDESGEYILSADILNDCYRNAVLSVQLLYNEKPAGEKSIQITVGGEKFEGVTDESGTAVFALDLNTGSYDAEISYENITVLKTITVKSTVEVETGDIYTYNSKLTGRLLDRSGNGASGRQFSIIIGSELYTLGCDSNGYFSLAVNLNPGTYNLRISNPYSGETVTKDIKVVPRLSQNSDLTMYAGTGKSYKVKVFDDYGYIACGVKVTFNVNGKNYYINSDGNGIASFKVTLNKGTYQISASYNGFRVSNKITVKATVITKNISVKKGKAIKFTAKILNTNGKIVKNKKVKFKFKGKSYTAKTNRRGTAKITIKNSCKIGKYKITTIYGKTKITNTIKIRK